MIHKTNKAFTLIELLIVIAILGALATIVIVNLNGAQSSARDAKRKSDLKQYETSIQAYSNRKNGLYPIHAATTQLKSMCTTDLNLTANLCPDDSDTTKHYSYISDGSGLNYVAWTELEKPDNSGNTQYFILCSDGNAGIANAAPSSSACPL